MVIQPWRRRAVEQILIALKILQRRQKRTRVINYRLTFLRFIVGIFHFSLDPDHLCSTGLFHVIVCRKYLGPLIWVLFLMGGWCFWVGSQPLLLKYLSFNYKRMDEKVFLTQLRTSQPKQTKENHKITFKFAKGKEILHIP